MPALSQTPPPRHAHLTKPGGWKCKKQFASCCLEEKPVGALCGTPPQPSQPSLPSSFSLPPLFRPIPLLHKTRLKPQRRRLVLSLRSRQKPWPCTRASSVPYARRLRTWILQLVLH